MTTRQRTWFVMAVAYGLLGLTSLFVWPGDSLWLPLLVLSPVLASRAAATAAETRIPTAVLATALAIVLGLYGLLMYASRLADETSPGAAPSPRTIPTWARVAVAAVWIFSMSVSYRRSRRGRV